MLTPGTGGDGFRVLGKFNSDGSVGEVSVVRMEAESLASLVKNEGKPMSVRCWAIDWLAQINNAEPYLIAALKAEDSPVDIRKTAARWLAVWLPEKGLSAVADVLWDKAAPTELQEACYYALDWALIAPRAKAVHPEVWKQIERAAGHPNAEISTAAKKKLDEKK